MRSENRETKRELSDTFSRAWHCLRSVAFSFGCFIIMILGFFLLFSDGTTKAMGLTMLEMRKQDFIEVLR